MSIIISFSALHALNDIRTKIGPAAHNAPPLTTSVASGITDPFVSIGGLIKIVNS